MSTSSYALTDEEKEYLAEREAIAEIEGGLSREDARVLAYKCYVHRFRPEFAGYYPMPGIEIN